jgi:hypothetical protein
MDKYFAEIDATELEWWSSELPAWKEGTGARVTGASPWNDNREKLADIDRRHGIAPGDSRLYSIQGYKADRARIELNWQQERERNGWISRPAPDALDFQAFWTAEYHHVCRLGDLDARHFGRLQLEHGHETESMRHLWAHITIFAIAMLETLRRTDSNLRSVDPLLQRVYSALHEMQVPWADSPPYHPLTWQESIDKLRSIANRLEADEAGEIVQPTNTSADSLPGAVQGEAGELDRFSAWLDEFTWATTNRVVENGGTQSFVADLKALNRLLPSAADHASCLEIVTAQEFVEITANLHRYVAAVVASQRQPLGLGQDPIAAELTELNAALRFAVPYLQRLAVHVRSGHKTTGSLPFDHKPVAVSAPALPPVPVNIEMPAIGGRTVAKDEYEARKRVAERWEQFAREYRELGYSRNSYEHFATWAAEQFDDMPSDDPEKLKALVDAHRKTPNPRKLV